MEDKRGRPAGQGHQRADLHPPREVVRIARLLAEAGHQAWAVGGAVRDALAGLHPGDWDLTTSARPGEVRRLFSRTVPIGIEHGTVGVLGKDGVLYEVTTFRRDVETDGRHARVVFADTLEEDLQRRDFTINAVAWNPLTGEIRDPHGGVEDLRAGVLRTVGEPAERFREDRLRVLRALRFAGRFHLSIEPATGAAIRASTGELGHLSAERVREELWKTLAGPCTPSATLKLYASSGVLGALYPELAACIGVADGAGEDVWEHQLRTADEIPRARPLLRLAALFHDVGKPVASGPDHAAAGAAIARAVMRRLKCSNADTDRVVHLVAQHESRPAPTASDPELRRWVRLVGLDFYRDLFRLWIACCRARGGDGAELLALWRRLRALLRDRPALALSDLAIGGAELRALGLPPGPLYGEILGDLLERVTDDPALNTRDQLLDIVRAGVADSG
ncbi:MAG TPA: CCA tRNA nucleotidyltransferase [Longimicrobiaceae bacterium]|nr:CCA tRNA nucleotidyltransferase [Longimicrobiaceae bacterium]